MSSISLDKCLDVNRMRQYHRHDLGLRQLSFSCLPGSSNDLGSFNIGIHTVCYTNKYCMLFLITNMYSTVEYSTAEYSTVQYIGRSSQEKVNNVGNTDRLRFNAQVKLQDDINCVSCMNIVYLLLQIIYGTDFLYYGFWVCKALKNIFMGQFLC